VVHDEVRDDAQAALVGRLDQRLEVLHRPVVGVDVVIIGDVVPVVFEGRGIDRQQPDAVHTQIANVIQLVDDAPQVAVPTPIRVAVGAHIKLVENGVLIPAGLFGIGHESRFNRYRGALIVCHLPRRVKESVSHHRPDFL
jgi:hypothetical protein